MLSWYILVYEYVSGGEESRKALRLTYGGVEVVVGGMFSAVYLEVGLERRGGPQREWTARVVFFYNAEQSEMTDPTRVPRGKTNQCTSIASEF